MQVHYSQTTRLTPRDWRILSPVVGVIVLGTVLPIIVMLVVSFSRAREYGGVAWGDLSFSSYVHLVFDRDLDGNLVLQSGHLRIFARSIWLAAVTTAGCFVLGFPTALYIATRSHNTRNLLLILVSVPFWTSLVVRSYGWVVLLADNGLLNRGLKDLHLVHGELNVLYTSTATIIGLLYTFIPFMVLPLYSSFAGLDWRIVEAAYDLGATRWGALLQVIVPNCMPGIMAGIGLVFVPALGAYVIPDLLGGSHSLMIGNLIELEFTQERDWPLGASLSLLLLGMALLVMLARRLNFRTPEVAG